MDSRLAAGSGSDALDHMVRLQWLGGGSLGSEGTGDLGRSVLAEVGGSLGPLQRAELKQKFGLDDEITREEADALGIAMKGSTSENEGGKGSGDKEGESSADGKGTSNEGGKDNESDGKESGSSNQGASSGGDVKGDTTDANGKDAGDGKDGADSAGDAKPDDRDTTNKTPNPEAGGPIGPAAAKTLAEIGAHAGGYLSTRGKKGASGGRLDSKVQGGRPAWRLGTRKDVNPLILTENRGGASIAAPIGSGGMKPAKGAGSATDPGREAGPKGPSKGGPGGKKPPEPT